MVYPPPLEGGGGYSLHGVGQRRRPGSPVISTLATLTTVFILLKFMTNLINAGQTMTSMQIAEVTGKRHSDVLRAIRNMEAAWEKALGRKFALQFRINELAILQISTLRFQSKKDSSPKTL